MERGPVYDTLRRLAGDLEREGLPYAILGGMAVVTHGYVRTTDDVDLVMTPETLEAFRRLLVGRGYRPAFVGASRTFRDAETGVRVEVIASGEFPGDGKPKAVTFPDPEAARIQQDGIWWITLEKLLELKLASGLTAPHRLKDLADVQELILRNALSESLAEKLDPSVRDEYLRLWRGAQSAPSIPE